MFVDVRGRERVGLMSLEGLCTCAAVRRPTRGTARHSTAVESRSRGALGPCVDVCARVAISRRCAMAIFAFRFWLLFARGVCTRRVYCTVACCEKPIIYLFFNIQILQYIALLSAFSILFLRREISNNRREKTEIVLIFLR